MRVQSIVASMLITVVTACGTARPDPNDYRAQPSSSGTPAPATQKTESKKTDTAKSDTSNTSNTMAPATTAPDTTKPATATTPPPAAAPKTPIRTLVNQTEIDSAKTAYGTDCARCHQPLATSAKKGRTRAQIEAAVTVAAHVNTAGLVAKWPKDVPDTMDDGVDTAMLKGSAMAEALK